MEKKFKVMPPHMPNYIRLENDKALIPVADLTKDEAEEFGELMKQTFIEHWKKQTKK